MFASWKKSYDQPRQHIKKQRHYFAKKICLVMYGCESWTIKKKAECQIIDVFWNVVLEKTLESLLDCKEIQPVHSKGNQSWIFTRRTNAETAILWPPDAENWFIGKDPDAGEDWRQEEKGMTGGDGCIVSWTRWTSACVSSGSWWWTGKPGVLQSVGSQRVRPNWVSELNWTATSPTFGNHKFIFHVCGIFSALHTSSFASFLNITHISDIL